jgi:hypothetical protein
MIFVVQLLVDFIKFWFIEAPVGLMEYFASLNTAAMKFLSLRILLVTFFKPWKNEYREGLVGFSIAMGMIIKSMFIVFDIVVLVALLLVETAMIALFVSWPIITVSMLVL